MSDETDGADTAPGVISRPLDYPPCKGEFTGPGMFAVGRAYRTELELLAALLRRWGETLH
jgi:hypothetical protein